MTRIRKKKLYDIRNQEKSPAKRIYRKIFREDPSNRRSNVTPVLVDADERSVKNVLNGISVYNSLKKKKSQIITF